VTVRAVVTKRRLGLAAVLVGAATLSGCGDSHGTAAAPRTIVIPIEHSTFGVEEVRVAAGETVRFVLENGDPIDHEFILGDERVQLRHERGTEPYHPPKPGEVTVPAGRTAETVVTFDPELFPGTDGPLIFGCHLPGHYAYGMRGVVVVG
jgi:uncharacterized cupredoxin-like copper-binding protein